MSLMEKVGQADAAEERVVDHLLLKELLKNLDKDERKLIYLRYFSEKTQTQVGKELGISQVQVSRMEKKLSTCSRRKISRLHWRKQDKSTSTTKPARTSTRA